jgi:uncharacterized membrane protein YcaP (DUF421 family)
VLFVVADVLRNGIAGIHTVAGAFFGAVTGFAASEILTRTAHRWSPPFRGRPDRPAVLIRDGQPVEDALFRASISLPQLREIARHAGFDELGDVRTAVLGQNGVVRLERRGEPGRSRDGR